MSTVRRFEDLVAWQKARTLTSSVYSLCREGELAKDFGLRDQIRRSVVSVQSNIAEGFGRGSDRDFVRFLRMSKASGCEFRSQLYNLLDAGYVEEVTFQSLYTASEETESITGGLIRYLESAAAK